MKTNGSALEVVNVVGLESYLLGVVPSEMPNKWPAEALAAQAVVARTYALAHLAKGGDYDLYPDTRSQVYRGIGAEAPSSNTAVSETANRIVLYDGEPADTFFSSSSGGKTANVLLASLQSGAVGVYEVHLELNSDLPTNPFTQLTIAQDVYVSNIVTIPVVNPNPTQ